MGEMFTGEANITFSYSGSGDIWLNMSVKAVAKIELNGTNLTENEGVTYDRHRLTIGGSVLNKEGPNELSFRYL